MTDADLFNIVSSTGLLFFLTWLLSVWARDASLVDRIWGLGFLTITVVLCLTSKTPLSLRSQITVILATLWAIRLSVYLYARNRKKGEDPRYRAFRESWGSHFELKSLFFIYALQLTLCLVIAAPLMVIIRAPHDSAEILTTIDIVGICLAFFGIIFESVADAQLASFKSDPKNRGQVLMSGVWSLSRHPNYFGEFCVWWGFFLIACTEPFGILTIISPLVMTVLLLKISGVSLLENKMHREKPMYRHYMEKTPAFFPRVWGARKSK